MRLYSAISFDRLKHPEAEEVKQYKHTSSHISQVERCGHAADFSPDKCQLGISPFVHGSSDSTTFAGHLHCLAVIRASRCSLTRSTDYLFREVDGAKSVFSAFIVAVARTPISASVTFQLFMYCHIQNTQNLKTEVPVSSSQRWLFPAANCSMGSVFNSSIHAAPLLKRSCTSFLLAWAFSEYCPRS